MEFEQLASHVSDIRDLDKVVILNKKNEPAVRIGYLATLFFEQGETLERRFLGNAVLRDFLATFE